jgi:hypothetical protein
VSSSQDHEWIGARERGESIDHIPAEARAKYERLQALIAALPGETPSAGWQQRVLAAIDEPEAPRAAVCRVPRWVGPAALAAAALVLAVVIAIPLSPTAIEPSLTTEVLSATAAHRGDASIGDTLVVTGVAGGPSELRIYGESGEPLARCGATSGSCTVKVQGDRRQFRLELVLSRRGAVRPVLFIGTSIRAPGATLDDDLAAAAHDKIPTITVVPVVVQ